MFKVQRIVDAFKFYTFSFELKMMSDQQNTNELGSKDVKKLLWQYSIPAIVGTTATSLYNIIDRIFIGNGVGDLALSGLAITFPVMNLLVAFGALVGAGASAMVSIRLGERNRERAIATLCNALLLNLTLSLMLLVSVFFFLDPILFAFGASEDTLPFAKDFITIILCGISFTHIYFGLNNVMRASGYPKKAMLTTLITVGVNVVLAPLYIFVFGWGIKGAAFATVCAQAVGATQVLWHFSQEKHHVHFCRKFFHFDFSIVKEIFSIGMSPFFMNISASGVNLLVNLSLKQHGGDLAIGAFGVISAVLGIFAMMMFGLNQGMQPIVGFNYGAKQFKRVRKVFKLTVMVSTSICVVAFIVGQGFPHLIAQVFVQSEVMIDHVVTGMRLCMLMFPIVGFQMTTSGFFQSIGKAKISVFLTLSRQLLFLIPMLLIFPHFWGLNGVWLSMSASDFLAAVVTGAVLLWQLKKILPR
ncbi:MAG: MATE family efflux transporter [Prevotellaceae bacterium]|jgi:putative MATE family efflux protein|nr:MATE family efflux transporter [Prevotellaceae bacterium]